MLSHDVVRDRSRIHNLLQHLAPLASEPNVSNFLFDLPKSMGLASNLLDTLIQPEINSILETGIPIHDILKEIDLGRILENEQMSRSGLRRQDVPRIFESFKSAAQAAAPHIKGLVRNFSKIMDLEVEMKGLDMKGSAFDLLACKSVVSCGVFAGHSVAAQRRAAGMRSCD